MAYLVILLSLVVGPPASSQGLRTPEYKEAITEGLDLLHRLEYDEAFQSFEALARAYPDHPGPRLAGAVAIWLRELFEREDLDLDRFISSGYFTRAARLDMSEEARQAFFERIAEARELAARYLEDDPGDPDARYYLGACEGALGAFAFTIDRSLRQAMSHGKKSYEIHRAVVEEYPDFGDSYMTVGTYEYVVSNLPWYIKWIATIVGYRGSEERAFEYLLRAAEKGYFVKIDARVLLMILYVREKQYDYALEVAHQLHGRFPENFLFHLNQAQILERMERREEAAGVLTEIVRRAESGTK
ncbi:MAG TPA: hypothetical protein VEK15_30335, partial [Vicinamibacteria bacterium]|nr:hypothetical protein [Vicinamibacteria bacterium]